MGLKDGPQVRILPTRKDPVRIPRSLKLACVTLWALAIPALSLLPARFFRSMAHAAPDLPGADKLVHALMYAILTGLALWARPQPNQRLRARTAWGVVALTALYGALMEALQGWSHASLHRSADPWDELANAVGATLVAAVWLLCRPRSAQGSVNGEL
jgi:hypothetical protein